MAARSWSRYYTRDYGITSAAAVCNVRTNARADRNHSGADVAVRLHGLRGHVVDAAASRRRRGSRAQSSNPFVQFADGSFIGDYSQIAMDTNGKAHASWTDFRGNPGHTPANQDVLIANFNP